MSVPDHPEPTAEIAELLSLIKTGRLFEVQTWLRANSLDLIRNQPPKLCPLRHAVKTGFYSLVEVILGVGGWTQVQLNAALKAAIESKRPDIAELLSHNGASIAAVDFVELCRSVQPEAIEQFIRAGVDPAKDNGFARALNETTARPLLRLYKSLRDEFPVLHAQASLALADAAREKKLRWAALLAWAGADPFMEVPCGLYDGWDFKEEESCTAAHEACTSGSGELVKVLQLKPTVEQALSLLADTACHPCAAIMKQLLATIPKDRLNQGEPPTCVAVERLVECYGISPSPVMEEYNWEPRRETLPCLELLFQAGAKWQPDIGRIKSIRRTLLRQPSYFMAGILHLLVHMPGATTTRLITELCNSSVLREKVTDSDKRLIKDIDAIREDVGARRP